MIRHTAGLTDRGVLNSASLPPSILKTATALKMASETNDKFNTDHVLILHSLWYQHLLSVVHFRHNPH